MLKSCVWYGCVRVVVPYIVHNTYATELSYDSDSRPHMYVYGNTIDVTTHDRVGAARRRAVLLLLGYSYSTYWTACLN